jgi:hypothetical protein
MLMLDTSVALVVIGVVVGTVVGTGVGTGVTVGVRGLRVPDVGNREPQGPPPTRMM